MATIDVTDESFREVYQNNDLIILDFWAGWCMPCHQFSPIFEEVSDEITDVKFVKVDSESETKLSSYFGVRSIPTIIIIREQLEVFRKSGGMNAAELKELLEQAKKLNMDEVRAEIEKEEAQND